MSAKLKAFAEAYEALSYEDKEALGVRMALEALHYFKDGKVDAASMIVGLEAACQVITDSGGSLPEEDYFYGRDDV